MKDKSLLKPLGWRIYNLFKFNAVDGIQYKASQRELAELFNVSTRTIRQTIHDIITKTDLALIGDDDGYRLAMNQEEHELYQRLIFSRLKSSLDRFLHASNGNASVIYNYLNNHKEAQTRAVSGQMRAELTKDTHDIVRKYVVDYK